MQQWILKSLGNSGTEDGGRRPNKRRARRSQALTDYAPEYRAAALFLLCWIVLQLVDDEVELNRAVFEAVATAPFNKGLNYTQFVQQLKTQ